MSSLRRSSLLPWFGAALALAAIVWLYRAVHHISSTTVALTLVLLVLVVAQWGLRLAIVASIAATLCYNFFFIPPVGTLTVSDPQNWLALMVFLATSMIGSRLSEEARREAKRARARQAELEMLYQLSRELMQTEFSSRFAEPVAAATARVLHADVGILLGEEFFSNTALRFTEEEIAPARALVAASPFGTPDLPAGAVIYRPLFSGTRTRGMLLLRSLTVSTQTLDALAGLVSFALERAKAMEEVAERRAGEQSERLRTVLLDSITHELRTPLTAIKAAASSLLFAPSASPNDQAEMLTVIDEECDRLDRLVSDVTDMAQLSARDIQMGAAAFSPQLLVQEALDASAPILTSASVSVSIAPDVREIEGDPVYLRKVLSHLLENATKYGPPAVKISLTIARVATGVEIRVADNGPGIRTDEQTRIFERFYRGQAHHAGVYGTGMGLAISRAILQAHGGSLEVQSTPGDGATFVAFLPQ